MPPKSPRREGVFRGNFGGGGEGNWEGGKTSLLPATFPTRTEPPETLTPPLGEGAKLRGRPEAWGGRGAREPPDILSLG